MLIQCPAKSRRIACVELIEIGLTGRQTQIADLGHGRIWISANRDDQSKAQRLLALVRSDDGGRLLGSGAERFFVSRRSSRKSFGSRRFQTNRQYTRGSLKKSSAVAFSHDHHS